jgi:hypothetical protein
LNACASAGTPAAAITLGVPIPRVDLPTGTGLLLLLALSQALFNGGATAAQTAQARANYDATIATYRNTVLTAFQEAETALSTLTVLGREAVVVQNRRLIASVQLIEALGGGWRGIWTGATRIDRPWSPHTRHWPRVLMRRLRANRAITKYLIEILLKCPRILTYRSDIRLFQIVV